MRMRTNEALVENDIDDGHKYVERWTGDPTVLARGPIAVMWGAYEFLIDGKFSHCGIDSADLAKLEGSWKIANWMWAVEKNCATGPPDADPNMNNVPANLRSSDTDRETT